MAEACQQWIWHASLCWRRNTTDCRTGYFSTGWHDYENWLGSVLRFCISWAVIHPAVGMPHCKHVTVMVSWCVDLHGDEAFIREVMITKEQQQLFTMWQKTSTTCMQFSVQSYQTILTMWQFSSVALMTCVVPAGHHLQLQRILLPSQKSYCPMARHESLCANCCIEKATTIFMCEDSGAILIAMPESTKQIFLLKKTLRHSWILSLNFGDIIAMF